MSTVLMKEKTEWSVLKREVSGKAASGDPSNWPLL